MNQAPKLLPLEGSRAPPAPTLPHLQGLLVPPGPMEHPSALQQPQRPNRQGTTAPGTSGSSRAGGLMTSGSSGESSWMEGRAGDGSSWYDWVTHTEAEPGACKERKLTQNSKHLAAPFPLHLRRPGRRRWALSTNTQWAWNHLRKIYP